MPLELFRTYRYPKKTSIVDDKHPNFFEETHSVGTTRVQLERGINAVAQVGVGSSHRVPAILIRTSPHKAGSATTPWQDRYNFAEGTVEYFGDARLKHMGVRDAKDVRGNQALLRQSKLHGAVSRSERLQAAPLLFFVTSHRHGSGYVDFVGLGVIEAAHRRRQEDPTNGKMFDNYAFDCSLLSLDQEDDKVDWEWITARRDPEVSLDDIYSLAPSSWKRFVDGESSFPELRGSWESAVRQARSQSLNLEVRSSTRPSVTTSASGDFNGERVLAVYVGDDMRENFETARKHGTWGLRVPQTAPLAAGDTALFIGSVGGSPRKSDRDWLESTASFCWTAEVTSTWFTNEEPIWENGSFPYRFTFKEPRDHGRVSLSPDCDFTRDGSLVVKRAATSNAGEGSEMGRQCQTFPRGQMFLGSEDGMTSVETDESDTAAFLGELNKATSTKARREQRKLRKILLEAGSACAICGRELDESLLVAAHIKARTHCDDDERRDLHNVAMLACRLGCDAAYEEGLLYVDQEGFVRLNESSRLRKYGDCVGDRLGLSCKAFRPETAQYFDWHRRHHAVR